MHMSYSNSNSKNDDNILVAWPSKPWPGPAGPNLRPCPYIQGPGLGLDLGQGSGLRVVDNSAFYISRQEELLYSNISPNSRTCGRELPPQVIQARPLAQGSLLTGPGPAYILS